MPSVEELEAALAEARRLQAQQTNVPTFVPENAERRMSEAIWPGETPPVDSPNRYAATTWGDSEFDFRTPSGQLCRLRKLDLEKLAEAGILEQVSRLPGLTGELIQKSSGQPPLPVPDPNAMPDRDTIKTLVELCNVIVPMVVVAPEISALPEEGEERIKGVIYVDSIEITDRIAIMNRVLGGLAKLDSFRNES